MTSQEIDLKSEELLKALGTELGNSRQRYASSILDNNIIPMPFHINETKKVSHKRLYKRVLVLVAVLILAMTLVLATATGVREKLFNYFFVEHQGYTELKSLETFTTDDNLPNFVLTEIPKGYKLAEEDNFAGVYNATYTNNTEQYLYFNVSRSDTYTATFDNETLNRKEISLGEYQGYMFYDENTSIILWQVGEYTLELNTVLDEDTAIKIAKNIFIK